MNRKSNVKTGLTFCWSSIIRKCMTDMKHCQQFPANKCWGFSFSRLCYHTFKLSGEEGLNICSHNAAYGDDRALHSCQSEQYHHPSGTHFRTNLIPDGGIWFCMQQIIFFAFQSHSLPHFSKSLSYFITLQTFITNNCTAPSKTKIKMHIHSI